MEARVGRKGEGGRERERVRVREREKQRGMRASTAVNVMQANQKGGKANARHFVCM